MRDDHIPGVSVIVKAGRDGLTAVDHASAAHSEEDIDPLLPADRNAFSYAVDFRIRRDAG